MTKKRSVDGWFTLFSYICKVLKKNTSNHNADGQWVIFRSDRVKGEALAKLFADSEAGKLKKKQAIEIQSAMLSEDGRSMNICIVKMPQHLIDRYRNK